MRKIPQILLTSFITFFLSLNVQASSLNGKQVYDACKAQSQAEKGFCLGYTIALVEGIKIGAAQVLVLSGASDTENLNKSVDQILQFCIGELSNGQIQDVFVGHLASQIELPLPARQYFLDAMRKSFPCKN